MRNLSKYQYGTLQWVDTNPVTLEDLEGVHGGTLWSLLHRHYLTKGEHKGRATRVFLTPAGKAAIAEYSQATQRERNNPGELTDRCMKMLRVARILRFEHHRKDAQRAGKVSQPTSAAS